MWVMKGNSVGKDLSSGVHAIPEDSEEEASANPVPVAGQ